MAKLIRVLAGILLVNSDHRKAWLTPGGQEKVEITVPTSTFVGLKNVKIPKGRRAPQPNKPKNQGIGPCWKRLQDIMICDKAKLLVLQSLALSFGSLNSYKAVSLLAIACCRLVVLGSLLL